MKAHAIFAKHFAGPWPPVEPQRNFAYLYNLYFESPFFEQSGSPVSGIGVSIRTDKPSAYPVAQYVEVFHSLVVCGTDFNNFFYYPVLGSYPGRIQQ
ncbi:hypothetical protein SDC9_162654 [bioreactor metagenome]|uniref:Uncharacterized protein n=1 Tax=bioreactor metagenome TaxID=1076179 RepID=A0A645FTA7_9ZZZZ